MYAHPVLTSAFNHIPEPNPQNADPSSPTPTASPIHAAPPISLASTHPAAPRPRAPLPSPSEPAITIRSFSPPPAPIPSRASPTSATLTATPMQDASSPPPPPLFYASDFAVTITVLEPVRNTDGLLTIATTVAPPPHSSRHRPRTGSPLRSVEAAPAAGEALPARHGDPSTADAGLASETPLRESTPADRLGATIEHWRREDEERRAREARKRWGVGKWERVVGKVRERRRRWVEGVREARERVWWDWQVWLCE